MWVAGYHGVYDDRALLLHVALARAVAFRGLGIRDLGFGIWGLGFGVWGLGFGIWGVGFGVWGLGFRV